MSALDAAMEEMLSEFATPLTLDIPALREQWDRLVILSEHGNMAEWDEQTEFEQEHFGELLAAAERMRSLLIKAAELFMLIAEELNA